MSSRRICFALSLLVLSAAPLLAPPAASADVRVWEQHPDDAAHHRYLDVTGFLQPGYIFRLTGNDKNAGVTDDTPWLHRARIGLAAQMVPWLRLRIELELAPVATLEDAYVEMPLSPAFAVRAGQFLVPFLRSYQYNELNLAFIDRPVYVPETPDRGYLRFLSPRDIGLEVHGLIGDPSPEGSSPVLAYHAGGFLGSGANINRNDDNALLWAARLQLHLLGVPEGAGSENDLAYNERPRVAVAAAVYSNCDDRANWNRGFTFDSELRFRGLYASAAVVWFRNSAAGTGLGKILGYGDFCKGSLLDASNPGGPTRDFVSRGVHVQVQYVLPTMLFPLHGQSLEVLARFGWVDPDSPYVASNPLFGGGTGSPNYEPPSSYTDSDNAPTRYRFTFGLNWFPTSDPELRLQVNYQLNREAEDVVTPGGVLVGIQNDIFWIQMTAGI